MYSIWQVGSEVPEFSIPSFLVCTNVFVSEKSSNLGLCETQVIIYLKKPKCRCIDSIFMVL